MVTFPEIIGACFQKGKRVRREEVGSLISYVFVVISPTCESDGKFRSSFFAAKKAYYLIAAAARTDVAAPRQMPTGAAAKCHREKS